LREGVAVTKHDPRMVKPVERVHPQAITMGARSCLGRDTCYVGAAEFEAGDHGCWFLPFTPVITIPKAKVAFFWYACVDGNLESFVSSYWKEDHVDQIIQQYSYTDFTYGHKSALDW
jgi:hypothetical protein